MTKIWEADNSKWLTRMRSNRDSHSLVGMQNDAGTLEDSWVVPYKAKQSSRRSHSESHYPLYVCLCVTLLLCNQFLISAIPKWMPVSHYSQLWRCVKEILFYYKEYSFSSICGTFMEGDCAEKQQNLNRVYKEKEFDRPLYLTTVR